MTIGETPEVPPAVQAGDDDADHTHPAVVHSHRHHHVFHHPASPGIFMRWDHRSFAHTHEHNHSEMTHSHTYKQEDEEKMHVEEAHVHDHAPPTQSPA